MYVLSSELISSLKSETDFSNQVIPRFLQQIFVVETDRTYIDIGMPETYQLAQEIANVK